MLVLRVYSLKKLHTFIISVTLYIHNHNPIRIEADIEARNSYNKTFSNVKEKFKEPLHDKILSSSFGTRTFWTQAREQQIQL